MTAGMPPAARARRAAPLPDSARTSAFNCVIDILGSSPLDDAPRTEMHEEPRRAWVLGRRPSAWPFMEAACVVDGTRGVNPCRVPRAERAKPPTDPTLFLFKHLDGARHEH